MVARLIDRESGLVRETEKARKRNLSDLKNNINVVATAYPTGLEDAHKIVIGFLKLMKILVDHTQNEFLRNQYEEEKADLEILRKELIDPRADIHEIQRINRKIQGWS